MIAILTFSVIKFEFAFVGTFGFIYSQYLLVFVFLGEAGLLLQWFETIVLSLDQLLGFPLYHFAHSGYVQ